MFWRFSTVNSVYGTMKSASGLKDTQTHKAWERKLMELSFALQSLLLAYCKSQFSAVSGSAKNIAGTSNCSILFQLLPWFWNEISFHHCRISARVWDPNLCKEPCSGSAGLTKSCYPFTFNNSEEDSNIPLPMKITALCRSGYSKGSKDYSRFSIL